jgi:predicted transcriptional regulator
MDFKDKFIRYHPDITFEIFELIWDKLHSMGYKDIAGTDINSRFKIFRNRNYLKLSSNAPNYFNTYKEIRSQYTEITIEEFLGYNPFIKSNNQPIAKYKIGDTLKTTNDGWQYSDTGINTKEAIGFMPSGESFISGKCIDIKYSKVNKCYWYKINSYLNMFTEDGVELIEESIKYDYETTITRAVKANDPNIIFTEGNISKEKFINNLKHAGCKLDSNKTILNCLTLSCRNDNCPFSQNKTIQETIDWLNQTNTITKSNEEYPEYYKFIGNNSSFTKGKIYKIKNPTNLEAEHNFIDDLNRPNGWGGYNECNHKYFKPSTKEAFDLQEKSKQNEIKMINKFKKDEYIIFTKGLSSTDFPLNYIFKQRQDKDHLSVYKDTTGIENGWEWHRNFNKLYLPDGQTEPIITDWRYATKEEIAEYNRLGEPYDVTTLNKPKFEVGKWYSFNWNGIIGINEKVICKAKEVKSNSITTSWRKHLYSHLINDYAEYFIEKISNIKELSLDEIQQYLPDGHPDKTTKEIYEFKVGDWIITKNYCEKYDEKPLHLTKIDAQGYCYFDNAEDKRDNCHLRNIIRLATTEEIKSVQPIESSEFVLPEKWCVYIKDSNLVSDKYKCSRYSENYYIYSEPVNSKEFNYIIGAGKLEEYTEITFDQFKHCVLKEEEIMKNNFKVGDYVEIIANTSYSCNKVGDIGIITEMGTTDDCRVECGSINYGNWSYLKELKLSSLEAYNKKYGISNSKDDILEEAKRRYPIGTNFISPHNNLPYKVHSKHKLWYDRTKDNILILISENIGDYVYFNGKWAKIIEEPNNESNYKINDCPFNESDLVSCEICGKYIEGKIHFEDNIIYICQNVQDGMGCKDKLGYKYSYCIYNKLSYAYDNFQEGCKWNAITNLKLLNKSKSSDSLDDEYNEIFSGEGIINQIKSKPATYSESFTPKNLEKAINDIKVSTTPKKTEIPKIELLKTTKI